MGRREREMVALVGPGQLASAALRLWASARVPLAARFACVALAGCFETPLFDGLECNEQAPCPDGYACGGDRRCHRECVADVECAREGDLCIGGFCALSGEGTSDGSGSGPCEGAACANLCTRDEDCPSSEERCVNGACAPAGECDSAADCVSPGPCQVVEGAACRGGRCLYAPLVCAEPPGSTCEAGDSIYRSYSDIGTCDPATGQCAYAAMEIACPGCLATCLEPCRQVVCDDTRGGCRESGHCVPGTLGEPAGCTYVDAADGGACTLNDGASPGLCSSGACVGCLEDGDCEGQNVCTAGRCDLATRTCVFEPRAGTCSDGNACTRMDTCQNGLCVGSDPVTCAAPPGECDEPAGTCDPASGACSYRSRATGVACSDDGNACTDDLCDGTGSCVHTPKPNGAACGDGSACTQVDACQNGTCVGSSPLACNSSPGQCYESAGTCNPSNASCSYAPKSNTSSCNDGNVCTHTDRCNGSGGCSGTSYSCNDGNRCTSDSCNGDGACTNTRIPPDGLTPTGGQVLTVNPTFTAVTMRWNACSDAQHYDVAVEIYSSGAWQFYFTYDENNPTAPPTNEKMYYPNTCNRSYRFRVRSYNGSSHGPWSGYSEWYAQCP